jgi:hypothetical protein
MSKQTRSGGLYGLRDVHDDEDGGGVARGGTRSGVTFRRVSRGYYPSIPALKKAHAKLFSQPATFVAAGECERRERGSAAGLLRPSLSPLPELPVSGHYSGIGQGVLRVNAGASESYIRKQLEKAYKRLDGYFPGRTAYVTLTANVILRSTVERSFSVYFGQSFGNAKTLFYGQTHDPVTGEVSQLFTEFELETRSDLATLPVRFTTEDFASLYKRNFERSNVVVHEVVSLVYIFSLGIERYEHDHELARNPLRLF